MPTNHTRNLRDATVTLKDGNTTPTTLALVADMGNLEFEETQNNIVILDRGILDHRRAGDEEVVKLSFGIKFKEYEADSVAALAEFVNKVANASAYVSTGTAGEPYSFDVDFLIVNPDTSGTDETISFTKVVKDTLAFSEGDEFNELQFAGTAFMTKPSSARA